MRRWHFRRGDTSTEPPDYPIELALGQTAEATIAALRSSGRLEAVDAALVAAARTTADALDRAESSYVTMGADGGWHMSEKHERLSHNRLFYAFLNLEPAEPQVFTVPCAVVQELVRTSHATWLALPGARGRVRRDSNVRRVRPSYQWDVPGYPDGWMDAWRERWDLLEADPTRLRAGVDSVRSE